MPIIDFAAVPDNARAWIFAADKPLEPLSASRLLDVVDWYLAQWRAHGVPLVSAREWRDERFLAIAVDEAASGASGCSIDGLFRALSSMEEKLGTSMIGSGRVFWRTSAGAIQSGTRKEFTDAAQRGEVTQSTSVFDLTVTTAGAFRREFEKPASASWHARLMVVKA